MERINKRPFVIGVSGGTCAGKVNMFHLACECYCIPNVRSIASLFNKFVPTSYIFKSFVFY